MSDTEFQNALQMHMHPLNGFAFRLTRDADEAKDLLQETLMKAYLNRNKFIRGSNLGAWLITIMKNSFINQYRRQKNKPEYAVSRIEGEPYLIQESTENSGLQQMSAEEIEREIEKLEEKIREPLVMYARGFKYTEIAERLDIPMGSVKNRIFIARTKLKEQLDRRKKISLSLA